MRDVEFIKELLDVLSLGSKLSDIFQKVGVVFSTRFGTRNFFFGDQIKVIYGIGSKPVKQIFSLMGSSQEGVEYRDVECVMRFSGGYFLYFDINSFALREDVILIYTLIDNFLRNYEKFVNIYDRFKYLKALVLSIEPLIYEVSIKNALSQSLVSLIMFSDIEKAIVANLSGKKIEVISAIGVESRLLIREDILRRVKEVIDSKKEVFFDLDVKGDGKVVMGVVPLGDFQEVRGILVVGFRKGKENVSEVDREILKILSFVITHRIKLYEMNINLMKAKKRAEELSKLKSEFVANVSHELRTPLNAILGFVELLKIGDFSKEDQTKYLDYIMSAGTSLLNMINNILDLSKIEAGAMKPMFVKVQLGEIIEDIKRYGEVLAKNKNIGFSVETYVDDITFKTDYTMAKSILMNIVSNSIKFTDKGWVKVSVGRKYDRLIFRVEDTGIGMKESELRKLFVPFTQLEKVRNKKYPGTGIGLSLSKKFADMINAKIVPRTKGIGKGCVFYVVFPIKE